mgnify:CR=1 FL=1
MYKREYKYKSLFDLWKKACDKYQDSIAFTDSTNSINITYKQAFNELCFLAEKLSNLGLKKQDNVCLFAANFPGWLIIEQAIITLGGVCVSKTSEINIKELDYVFEDSDCIALITDNSEIIDYFFDNKDKKVNDLKFIIYTGKNKEFKNSKNVIFLSDILKELDTEKEKNLKRDWEETPEDIAYINYTSGTSASPKGAMLPNIGMSYVVEELQKFNKIISGKKFVVTFPLSSAGGKSFVLLCFSEGCKIIFTKYKDFYTVIDREKPDYLHCAPKIMQTIHSKLMDEANNRGLIFSKLYKTAFFISQIILKLERSKKTFFLIKKLKKIIDKYIYKPVRNKLFKDEIIIFVGSAHLAKPLEDYYDIISVPLIQHYGLTETTGLAVSNTLESQKEHYYTVGVAFEGTTIRIINPETHQELKPGQIGLITLGGIEIMKGYYKNPEATSKALLEDNFLNTGDLGYVDKDGYLTVLSRYDDVIVMSNGYNVFTPLLENEAKDSEYIKQLVIVGHGKPFLAALAVLENKQYNEWCEKNHINKSEPNNNEVFKQFIIEHLNEKIRRKRDFRYFEKLKKIYFLKDEFTVDNGLLTTTLKTKYKAVCRKYDKEIENLYKE